MNVAITGGNGFIGSRLIELLLREGHSVTCLVRKTSNLQWIQSLPVTFLYGDVRDPAGLTDFVTGKDIIFHCAGLVKGKPEELMEANAGGTANLLRAVRAYNPDIRRFVFISSQEAAGLIGGSEPWTEDITPAPSTAYGRSKARGEEVCREYASEVPVTIVRPSPVYGPRDRETFLFFKMAAKGIGIVPNPETRVSTIYSVNLAYGIYLSALSEKSVGETYFLADDDVVTWQTLNAVIGNALGIQPKQLRIPEFVLKTYAACSEFFASLAGKASIVNRDKISMLVHPNLVVSNAKAKRDFGYSQQTPMNEAVAATVKWYREHRWI
jgi:dihydroflavonol-4-reductase